MQKPFLVVPFIQGVGINPTGKRPSGACSSSLLEADLQTKMVSKNFYRICNFILWNPTLSEVTARMSVVGRKVPEFYCQ